jgi:hypothetical protein
MILWKDEESNPSNRSIPGIRRRKCHRMKRSENYHTCVIAKNDNTANSLLTNTPWESHFSMGYEIMVE